MTRKSSGNPIRFLPNLITVGNLFCGCLSISNSALNELKWAVIWIIIGLILDFLDGWAARLLEVTSSLGKELDSFSDLVSFGLAPSFLLFEILKPVFPIQNGLYSLIPFLSWLIVVFSAIRLARFNLGLQEIKEGFLGLPTPANALLICSIPMVKFYNPQLFNIWIGKPAVVIIFITFSSALLVFPVRLLSLKFKHLRWKENQGRYLFLGTSLLAIIMATQFSFLFLVLPLIIFIYIIYSCIQSLIKSVL